MNRLTQIILFSLFTIASSTSTAAPKTFFEIDGLYGGYFDSSDFMIVQTDPFGEWARMGKATMAFRITRTDWPDEYFPIHNLILSTARLGHDIIPGVYDDAACLCRPEEKAGILYDVNGQGTNIDGGFTVYDATLGSNGKIASFAATFYLGESPDRTSQIGKIWFNSEAVIPPVPEPKSIGMWALGLFAISMMRGARC